MFMDFFFNFKLKKQPKNKTTKNRIKTCPQTIERIKSGQVSNTHLRESFLTHIAQVFGFVGENPCETECI